MKGTKQNLIKLRTKKRKLAKQTAEAKVWRIRRGQAR